MHFITHDLGAFGRVVQRIHVQVAKCDQRLWIIRCLALVCEYTVIVQEDSIKQVVLDVVSREGLRIVTLDGHIDLAGEVLASGERDATRLLTLVFL